MAKKKQRKKPKTFAEKHPFITLATLPISLPVMVAADMAKDNKKRKSAARKKTTAKKTRLVTNPRHQAMVVPNRAQPAMYTPAPKVRSFDLSAELRKIDSMEGHAFEYWCADLLKENDFTNVTVTRGSNDHGGDIVAFKNGTKYLIQCKRYSSNVGNEAVKEAFYAKTVYGCQVATVMTNQHFTKSAIEGARATGVNLWSRNEIISMLDNRRWYLYRDNKKWPHNRGSREINFAYYNSFPPVPLLQGMKPYIQCVPLGGPTEKWNPYVLYDKDPEMHYMIEIVSENFPSSLAAEHFQKAITKRYYALAPYGVIHGDSYFVRAYIHGEYIREKFNYNDACFYLENWAE